MPLPNWHYVSVWLLPAVMFLGPVASRTYVNAFGVKGSGTVVSSFNTNNQYNNRDVIGYKTVLKLQDGTRESEFADLSGNVYGANEGWFALPPRPGVGQTFAVKYMPGLPENFIILANDTQTDFGRSVQCQPLQQQHAEALQNTNSTKPTPISNKRHWRKSMNCWPETAFQKPRNPCIQA